MQPNRMMYGAWAILLAAAATIAVVNSREKSVQAEPEPALETQEVVEDKPLSVNRVGFTQQAPGRLPVVSDKDPLAEAKLKELRRIVADEMPNASSEEADIWTEEFRDLPEDAVRFLLRQKIKSGAGEQTTKSPLVQVPSPPAELAAPSTDMLSKAIGIVSANLMNTKTVGYRRRIVEFAGTESAATIAEVRTDIVAGQRVSTGGTLDLALESGYFAVTEGQSRYFTRVGRFALIDGRIGLLIGTRTLLVEGVREIPAEATAIAIADDGAVTAVTREKDVEVGRVAVFEFLDASRLQRADGCLLVESAASGTGSPVASPVVKQGWLEQSNVNGPEEQRLLDTLRGWRKLAAGH